MSKVALSGNASGTGTFTIASPNSNTDRTLTLPDASGTVQVSGQPVSATTGTFSGDVTLGTSVLATPSGSAPSYTCRAWCNFNGTGTVAIRASGNVSSITDAGTGYYGINFTTAMPDANYAAATQGNLTNTAGSWGYTGFEKGVRSASGYVVQFAVTSTLAAADVEIATVTIFR